MFAKTASLALLAAGAAAVPNMPRSEVRSFSLQSWGPLETGISKDVIFVDADLVSASFVSEIKSAGKKVVCYVDAGTLEDWRDDSSEFNNAEMGKKYKGFGGSETWLDVTAWQTFKEPMKKRIQTARDKGCQFIEFDNTDCDINLKACIPWASQSDYNYLASCQRDYINWLISTAHGMGMGVGLKNSQHHIPDVQDVIEFAINEECQTYDECDLYSKLSIDNKPVFGVEYNSHGGKVCSTANEKRMIVKYRDGSTWKDCF